VAIWGAIRLARPGSWWAAHRYATRLQLARCAASRYDHRNEEFWNRLRDFVADAPTQQTRQEEGTAPPARPAATRGHLLCPDTASATGKTGTRTDTGHEDHNTPNKRKHLKSLALGPQGPYAVAGDRLFLRAC
jgi:hypothetical protein